MRVPYVLHSLKRINGNFSLSYLKSHLTELMTWITLYLPQYLSCWTHRLITITTLNLAKTSPRIYLAISSFYGLLYRNKILVSLLHLDPDPDIMIPYDLYADSVKLSSYHTGQFTVYNTHFFIQENTMKKKWKISLMTSTWHFSGVATLKHCLHWYFLKTVIFPMQIPNRVCAKTFHYA